MEKAGNWKHFGYTVHIMYRLYLPYLVNEIIGKAIGKFTIKVNFYNFIPVLSNDKNTTNFPEII